MKARSVFLVVAALLAASTLTPKLQAQPPINIETVTVGDAGNAADTTGYGAVNYEFNIGKHEVTIGQYSSFLNSAASVTSDSYIVDLWNPNMATDFNTAGISRSGSGTLASPYSYSMIGSRNRPAGGKVFYLDPEDIPARMVARLLALGIDREAIRQRLFYLNDVGPADYAPVHEWAKRLKPEMVILDGLAEALAREGLDENKQADILTFFRNCIRPFADNGSAVVIADHVTKSAETRGSWPRGAGAKMGHYHGVSYEIILGESYTPAKAGHVRMKISKDRNGGVGPQGMVVAHPHFTPGEDGMTTTEWKQPTPAEEFRPTEIMAKIVKYLELHRSANKRELRGLDNSDYVDKTINALMKDGLLSKQRRGNSHIYTLTPKTAE